jgi:tRNA threonylcarbamoyladenosine biosynthesis protein TsaE
MIFTLLSSAPKESLAIGRRLGSQLRGSEIVLVSGELGAGKTTFIKGLAQSLGIPVGDVVSPSYVLMNHYRGTHDLFHFDLYRLGPLPAGLENPVDEYVGAGVLAVEWAQYLGRDYFSLPEAIAVSIEAGQGDERRVTLSSALPYIFPA